MLLEKNKEFNQEEADRLVDKKISGLMIYSNNIECLVDDVVYSDHIVRPVLHILAPNEKNAMLCLKSYKKIKSYRMKTHQKKSELSKIKIIITLVQNKDLL